MANDLGFGSDKFRCLVGCWQGSAGRGMWARWGGGAVSQGPGCRAGAVLQGSDRARDAVWSRCSQVRRPVTASRPASQSKLSCRSLGPNKFRFSSYRTLSVIQRKASDKTRSKPRRIKTIVRHRAFVVCYLSMHPRNREILGPVMRAYGNKDQKPTEKSSRSDVPRRDHNPSPPRQLSLLDK